MYEDYISYADGTEASPDDSPSALTGNDGTITGTSNYSTDTGTSGSTGGVINSSANPITTNSGPVDASGGNGSIPNVLQNIATQGLNDAVVSATEFGLGSLTDLLRTSAGGVTTAASAPSPQTAVATSGIPTWAYAVGAVAVIALLIHFTNKS